MQLCSAAFAACVVSVFTFGASAQAVDMRTVPVEASAGLAVQRTAASLLEAQGTTQASGLDLASLANGAERKVSVIAPGSDGTRLGVTMGSNSWDMGSSVPSWGTAPHAEAAASSGGSGGRNVLLFGGGSFGALAFASLGWLVVRRGPSTGETR